LFQPDCSYVQSILNRELSRHEGPLVIFGQLLDNQFDRHLTAAIRSSRRKFLGIGVYPGNESEAIAEAKAKWAAKFPSIELAFFD